MVITINVCEKCGYWPINGEEREWACKQCGNHYVSDGTLRGTYNAASQHIPMPTARLAMTSH